MLATGPQELTNQDESPTRVAWNCPVQVRALTHKINRSTALQLVKPSDQRGWLKPKVFAPVKPGSSPMLN